MITNRFASSLGVLAVGAMLLPACGDSRTDKFKREYKAQRAEWRAISSGIDSTIRSAARQRELRLAGQFQSLAKRTQAVIERLRALSPPDEVKGDFENLKASLTKGETDLKAIESALRRNDAVGARYGTQALVTDRLAINRTADAIVSKLEK